MGIFNFGKKKKSLSAENNIVDNKQGAVCPKNKDIDKVPCPIRLEKLSITDFNESKLIDIKEPELLSGLKEMLYFVGDSGIEIANKLLHKEEDDKDIGKSEKNNDTTKNNEESECVDSIKLNIKSLLSPDVNNLIATANIVSNFIELYYLKQINSELGGINESISRISDFLDIQYRSQVESLYESVFVITQYRKASSENEELRNRELDNIQRLKENCQQLLNQAEMNVVNSTHRDCNNYNDYIKQVKEIETWTQSQIVLINILYQIDTLDFILHKGKKSKEQSFGSFSLHENELNKNRNLVAEWHKKYCDKFEIDLTNGSRRKHSGVIVAVENLMRLKNDKFMYCNIEPKIIDVIKQQIEIKPVTFNSVGNVFDENFEIIIKNGKCFYCPKK